MLRDKTTNKKKEKSGQTAPRRDLLQELKSWVHGAGMRSLLVMAAGAVMMFVMFSFVCVSSRYSLEEGDIADRSIAATKEVEDKLATSGQRERAAQAVGTIYFRSQEVDEEVLASLDAIFDQLEQVQDYAKLIRSRDGEENYSVQYSFAREDVEYAQSLVSLIDLSTYQTRVLMNTDDEAFETMRDEVRTAVSDALKNSITQGQETPTISSIISVCKYVINTDLANSIVRPVLTASVRANMLVDETETELARERARSSVEPVIYKQGQYIVRVGDRVTANQLAMLSELGMLTSSDFNFSVYGGAALIIICGLLVMAMLLGLLEPRALRDMRSILVIILTMLISEALSVVCVTLINVYLSPVALCAILLTSLLGPKVGAAGNLAMTIIISALSAASSNSYSTEMVHLLLTGFVGSVVAVQFLTGKVQRVSNVICGAVVALSNLLVMLAVGLMTAVDLQNTMISAVWSMASGILSGLIAVGLQPVFEATFNLATPSKLMELANPNQPLLRRLMMEAPGTYHHSIVVANLAEAAAERIGANPLLARTGAYFHDIGKLKRPMYFKENQRGENPHDRTPAYVSAAIVTAHTKDGLALAQKHRLPPEIQRIIFEHHGDTPVMYFYHKALQQADGNPVDVKDFRYSGNRPGTKESAVVMLADTIEAAVRSMPDPTPQTIERFIERLVRGKIEDGQLSNSPLSLHDIDDICEAFIKVLSGVFHERIEYPNVQLNQGTEAVVPAVTARPATEAQPSAESADAMPEPYSPPMPDGMMPQEAGAQTTEDELPAEGEAKE